MQCITYKNNYDLSMQVFNEVSELAPGSNILIPSGSTPIAIYDELSKSDFIGKHYFYALDEWLNVPIESDGSCFSMITRDFVQKCNVKIDLTCFDPSASESENVELYKSKLNGSEFDYVLLGVGMNGHIGLNEPGVPFDVDYLVSQLDQVTIDVASDKYFSNDVVLAKGITVGIKKILKSKKVIIVINSSQKSEIFKRIEMEEGNESNIPSIYMKDFPNVHFYITENVKGK